MAQLFTSFLSKSNNEELFSKQEIKQFSKTKYRNFGSLPSELLDAIVDWRFGWEGTKIILEALKSNNTPFTILDFSILQADTFTKSSIEDFLVSSFSILANEAVKIKKEFDVGIESSTYAKIAFSTVKENSSILPLSKAPLEIEGFPQFLHPVIKHALEVYSMLHQQPEIIPAKQIALGEIKKIDPITYKTIMDARNPSTSLATLEESRIL